MYLYIVRIYFIYLFPVGMHIILDYVSLEKFKNVITHIPTVENDPCKIFTLSLVQYYFNEHYFTLNIK